MSSTTIAYIADRIFDGYQWHDDHALVIENGKLRELISKSSLPPQIITRDFGPGTRIVPSFIELQVYGALGKLLAMHPTTEALECLVKFAREGGTRWSMPTVATNTYEVFYQCIDAVRAYWNSGGDGITGLHLEGPWLHPLRKGAHKEEWIHVPTLEQAKTLLEYGKGIIKMMTIAPEQLSQELMDLLRSYDIILSAGHSNATYQEAKYAFSNGVRAVTHLYNAMSPLQHRAPGLAGAAMDDDKVMVSIIPDGHHVDYAALRIAKAVVKERLFVITDAVTDTPDGPYPHTKAGDKYESNGILSGSALQMNEAVRNLVQHVGVEPGEAIRMCSLYPAQVLKNPEITGRLKPGESAYLTVLDADYNVVATV